MDGSWVYYHGWSSRHYAYCAAYAEIEKREQAEWRLKTAAQLTRLKSGIPDGWPDTLAEYLEAYAETAGTQRGRKTAAGFVAASTFERVPVDGFTLHGVPGCGKTTLMATVARELAARRIAVRWVHLPSFQQEMHHAMDNDATGVLIEHVEEGRVIVIDDLGSETFSPWFFGIVSDLVQHCIDRRKPLLATTQYEREDLRQHYLIGRTGKGGSIDAGTVDRVISRLKQASGQLEFGDGTDHREEQWSFMR